MKRSRSSFFNRMSLAWQIVILLSVALLPIGGLAVYEATRANERAKSLTISELVSQARTATEAERRGIAEAFGTTAALAHNSLIYNGTAQECSGELRRFIDASSQYIFAGFIETHGVMYCSSRVGIVRDYSESVDYLSQRDNPRRTARVIESGGITNRAIVLIVQPVFVAGEWRGTVVMSVPREAIGVLSDGRHSSGLNAALLDDRGRILSHAAQSQDEGWWLPVGLENREDDGARITVFEGVDAFGSERTYVRVPLVENEVAVLFSNPAHDSVAGTLIPALRAVLLPGLVWMICIALAYVAMRRLVVNGIQRIQQSILAFKSGDRERALRPISGAAGELEELSKSFAEMARAVDAGEQDLSDLVEEKTVLLLEVYHRVKNNLQLIISIMNIQLRGAQDERERIAITTLRERVMGLALVHQRLYETPNLTSVPADTLVREIVSNLSEAVGHDSGATILTELDSFGLHPDQAVPFSLLVTEAMMNALNYSRWGTKEWRIDISLSIDEGGRVVLNVSNTISAAGEDAPASRITGMGQPLIRAFVLQLSGAMSVQQTNDEYQLEISFKQASLDEMGGQSIGMPGQHKSAKLARGKR